MVTSLGGSDEPATPSPCPERDRLAVGLVEWSIRASAVWFGCTDATIRTGEPQITLDGAWNPAPSGADRGTATDEVTMAATDPQPGDLGGGELEITRHRTSRPGRRPHQLFDRDEYPSTSPDTVFDLAGEPFGSPGWHGDDDLESVGGRCDALCPSGGTAIGIDDDQAFDRQPDLTGGFDTQHRCTDRRHP